MDKYEVNELGFEAVNVVNGRSTKQTYYRVALFGKLRLAVGRAYWGKGNKRKRGGLFSETQVDCIVAKVHVEYDPDEQKSADLSNRCQKMGTNGHLSARSAYRTGYVKVQYAEHGTENLNWAVWEQKEAALLKLANFVIKQAKEDGADIVCKAEHLAAFLGTQFLSIQKPEGRKKKFTDVPLMAWYTPNSSYPDVAVEKE